MPLFDFSCTHCGAIIPDIYQPITDTPRTMPCPTCNGLAKKIMSFPAIKRSLPEHFNTSLGRPVVNERDYRDGLREASDKASAHAGYDVNYSPVDLHDTDSIGVTDEGMDATRRAEVDAGKRKTQQYFSG